MHQLGERLALFEADAAGMKADTDGERRRAAEAFWSAKERLYRPIWGLGLARHIFAFDCSYFLPKWLNPPPPNQDGGKQPEA